MSSKCPLGEKCPAERELSRLADLAIARSRRLKEEFGWLVERGETKPEAVLYFCWEVFTDKGVDVRHWGWTSDNLKAARFSRKTDAELAWQAVTGRDLQEVDIHEHAWS